MLNLLETDGVEQKPLEEDVTIEIVHVDPIVPDLTVIISVVQRNLKAWSLLSSSSVMWQWKIPVVNRKIIEK